VAEFDLNNIPDDVKPHDLFTHYKPEDVAKNENAQRWLIEKMRAARKIFIEKEEKPKKPRKTKKTAKEIDLGAKVDDLPW